MATRFQRRPFEIFLMIFVTLAAQQVVHSAEPDSDSRDSAPAPVIEFQNFSASGQYSDALALAAHVIDQGDDFGAETRALLVEPLMKLAMIEKISGENFKAERAGELAIELIERNGGVFDPALIEPLVFLARLEQENGDHPAALERLNRAQHISHRADGVMSQEQLPILARMTKSYSAMNQRIMANMMIAQSYAIKMRKLDQNSIEAVPIVLEQAEIRAMNSQFRQARGLIYLSLDILEQSLPENDPGFLEALNGLASVRYMEVVSSGAGIGGYRLGRKEGTRALQRMITIMDEHHEQFSAIRRAETYIRLGDWYMLLRKPGRSDAAYRNAWNILNKEENAEKLLVSYFGQPRRLRYIKPSPPRNGPGMYENYHGRYVVVKYTVGKNGAARNVKLVNSNSPSAMNTIMRGSVLRAIYRPRYENAQPVATDNLFLREDFARGAWPARN
jgi:tetratricopeptide (TPR) repeat protein